MIQAKKDYLKWLADNIKEQKLKNGWIEISTPFLDQFNDGIVLYVHDEGDKIILSDDVKVASNTIGLGEPPKQQKIDAFRYFLNQYGITVTWSGEMQMTSTPDRYPIHFHLFLQAIMSANDRFYSKQLYKR